jgi:hypothetical protein
MSRDGHIGSSIKLHGVDDTRDDGIRIMGWEMDTRTRGYGSVMAGWQLGAHI